MRQIFTFLILLGTLFSKAQSTIPISHAAGVTVTASSVYAPQPMASLNDFNICSTGNTGTYGGWMQLDLGASYSISTIRWWVNMAPSGNVTSEVWQVSPDGVTWTTVANTSGAHANNEERFISFTPVTGRYVRVTQSGTPSWFSIGEIIVNEPYFKDNIYQYMLPKVLDSTGKVFSGNVTLFPYTFYCSKASTYQWKLNGTNIPGATSQAYTATIGGNYTCTVTYPSAGSCGYGFTATAVPAGAALWLRADSAVTYNASNLVSQWNDVSGNNRHVTQALAANRPTFINASVGNKPSLYFDGAVGKYFLNNTTQDVVPAGSARTVFVVGKRDCKIHAGGNTGGSLLTFRRTTLINSLSFGTDTRFSTSAVYVYSDGVNGFNNATIASNASDTLLKPFQLTYKVPAAGGKIGLNLNGINYPITQTGNVVAETGVTGFTVGDREDQADADWNGWISEIIVYQSLLTPAEIANVENYLNQKYLNNGNSPFTALPVASQTASNNVSDDGFCKHTYNTAAPNAVISSVRDNCSALGARTDVVYADANATLNGGSYTMRRHYVINVAADPAGTKRVRLYYTNADFTDLQAVVPSLTSAGQLVVTKYDGANEDGVYDITGGTITFIPAAQITTGTAFGQNYLEFNVAGFSEFWIHTGSAALPLKFLSFNAQKCNKTSVCLDWKTANEQHVSHFEIERSEDGRVFRSVGTKSANNQPANSYNATDNFSSLSNTKIFYRIKQIDTDGKYSYSDVRTVMNTDKISLGIYPNPATDVVNIAAWANIKSMQLFDVSGRMLSDLKPQAVINVSALQRGTYILKVQMKNGEMLMEKIMKQ